MSFSFSLGSTVTFFLLWSSSALLRALGQDIMRYLYISTDELCLLSFAGVMDWHCGSVCSVTFKITHFWVGGEAVYWHSFNYITYSAPPLFAQSINSLVGMTRAPDISTENGMAEIIIVGQNTALKNLWFNAWEAGKICFWQAFELDNNDKT